jgi:hypothetical protein
MKNHQLICFLFALVVAGGTPAGTVTASPEAQALGRRWLNIPWTIRYVLFVDTAKKAADSAAYARDANMADNQIGKGYTYWVGEALLTSPTVLISPGAAPLAVSLFTFNTQGHIISGDPLLSQYSGKISVIDRLVLVREDAKNEKPYYIAELAQGVPGDVTFSPAVCTSLDTDRYGPRWKSGGSLGDFGCREWTAQLKYWNQPYIDVTTYTKRGNFIGEFLGWSRFEDQPKPVIGMHGKHWLCLHECPAGETPGLIADIRAWTRKHNFPMPVRPKRQPEYPDSHYQDDFNEFIHY